MLNKLK